MGEPITIDTESGKWLSDGFITTDQAVVVAASVLPGVTPEQVLTWYNSQLDDYQGPLHELASTIREINTGNGWTDSHESATHQIAILALITTEVSEAIEEIRHGRAPVESYYTGSNTSPYDASVALNDDGTPRKPEGVPSELADIIIRTLDFAAMFNIDVDQAVAEKLAYNRTRGRRHGGKTL